MNIRDRFEKETGHRKRYSFVDPEYDDEYVQWLEEQLTKTHDLIFVLYDEIIDPGADVAFLEIESAMGRRSCNKVVKSLKQLRKLYPIPKPQDDE